MAANNNNENKQISATATMESLLGSGKVAYQPTNGYILAAFLMGGQRPGLSSPIPAPLDYSLKGDKRADRDKVEETNGYNGTFRASQAAAAAAAAEMEFSILRHLLENGKRHHTLSVPGLEKPCFEYFDRRSMIGPGMITRDYYPMSNYPGVNFPLNYGHPFNTAATFPFLLGREDDEAASHIRLEYLIHPPPEGEQQPEVIGMQETSGGTGSEDNSTIVVDDNESTSGGGSSSGISTSGTEDDNGDEEMEGDDEREDDPSDAEDRPLVIDEARAQGGGQPEVEEFQAGGGQQEPLDMNSDPGYYYTSYQLEPLNLSCH